MSFPLLTRFRRAENGAALVEFAISLPLILVVSFGTIESMRLFWSYQAAVAGVRDAARYVARVAPGDTCQPGAPDIGTALSSLNVDPETIIDSARTFVSGDDGVLYTPGVTIVNVTTEITCVSTLGLRQASVPVVRVSADMNITMPFSGVFALVGGNGFGTITTRIIEDARVYGV